MARYKDEILHEDVDGIEEYDNPPPTWLMGILYVAIVFSVLYVAFYALSFGSDAHESEYRAEMVADRAEIQAYYDANPIVPPSAQELLAGAVDPEVLALGETFFLKTCASCHGDQAQGLIGPNLTDDHWLHGGKVTEVFQAIVKGVPAKGMPPWGRAFAPEELTALAAYVRSLNGTKPPKARTPEGRKVAPEPLPAP